MTSGWQRGMKMPNENSNAIVICPFFHKINRLGIVCDGICTLSLRCVTEFLNNDIRDEYIKDFCASYDWLECPLARILSHMND